MTILDPPICTYCVINSAIVVTPTTYRCEIILINGGQSTGKLNPSTGFTIIYDATYIQPGMWIGNFLDGYAFRINTILSISSVSYVNDKITCIIEDVDGINAKIDPSSGGNGGGPSLYTNSYIFQLADGLPTLSQVQFPQNITWTDSIMGRFVAYRTGISGPTGPTGATGTVGATGATGATGPIRKGYYSTFTQTIPFLTEGTTRILTSTNLVGLDLSIGNSVIIQNLDNSSTQFEGIISNYDSVTGTITLRDITNIFGSGYGSVSYTWSINLTGPRGTKFFQDILPAPSTLGRIGDYYINKLTGELYLRQ